MKRLLPRLIAVMSKQGEPAYDRDLPAWHPQRLSNRTKVSLILLMIVTGIVVLDIIGPMLLSSGQGVVSGRLRDQLAVLAVLSVPLMLVLLAIGFVLGMTECYSARKALRTLSRITIAATVLHLVLLLLGTFLVVAALALLVGPRASIPGPLCEGLLELKARYAPQSHGAPGRSRQQLPIGRECDERTPVGVHGSVCCIQCGKQTSVGRIPAGQTSPDRAVITFDAMFPETGIAFVVLRLVGGHSHI
jgi:hypothetical protein